jgi:hypothetical protein
MGIDIAKHLIEHAVLNLRGTYVPYLGAVKNVDLGSFNLTTTGTARIDGGIGVGVDPGDDRISVSYGPVNDTAAYAQTFLYRPSTTTDGSFAYRCLNYVVNPLVTATKTNTSEIHAIYGSNLGDTGFAGDLGSLYGQENIYGLFTNATGTVTSVYGLRLRPYIKAGTVSNFYNIYIDAPFTGGTNSNPWSIYDESTWDWYCSGNVGIGTTTTTYPLNVGGTGIVIQGGSDPAVFAIGTTNTVGAFVGGYYTAGGNSSTIYFGQNYYFDGAWQIPDSGQKTVRMLLQAGLFRVSTTNINGDNPVTRLEVQPLGNVIIHKNAILNYGTNASSRSWMFFKDSAEFGDFNIGQSTTRTGSTYSVKFRIKANGRVSIPTDSQLLVFGAGSDASITYDGTNMIINPQVVGSGHMAITGTYAPALETITSNTALNSTHSTVLIDTSSGNVTVTLPAASTVTDRIYTIKLIDDTNTGDVATNGSEEIDGDSNNFVLTLHESIQIQSDGSNWWII